MPSLPCLRRRPLLALPVLISALTGCPGHLENPERFRDAGADSDPDLQTSLLTPRCATSNCHGAGRPAGGLDLHSPGLASRLVGAPSTTCEGRVLVFPDNPGQGYFFEILQAMPACGSRMPLLGTPLTEAEIDALRAYVTALAHEPPVDAGTLDSGSDAP
jgi:hypothetical protein